MASHGAPFLSRTTSDAIKIARVLCISLMIFAHVWPGAGRVTEAEAGPFLEALYNLVVNELARGSVPLLSVISGLLFWRRLERNGSVTKVALDKARTLLVPMMSWSAILLGMTGAYALLTGTAAFEGWTALDWLNSVLALTEEPVNLPLAFLRDVFACCIVVAAWRRFLAGRNEAVLLVVALWAVAEMFAGGAMLLRPQIALFFVLGFAIGVVRREVPVLAWPPVVVLCVSYVVVRQNPGVVGTGEAAEEIVSLLHRLTVATVFWQASVALARARGPVSVWLTRTEPLIFLVFCSHMATISFLAPGLDWLGWTEDQPRYVFIFFLQLPIVFLAAVLIERIGPRVSPALFGWLTAREADRTAI